MAKLIKMRKTPVDKETGEELLLCPRCKVYMRKLIKNDVILDICDKCKGMWIDDGEIDKLIKLSRGKTQ